METSWTEERAVPAARAVGLFWILLAGVLVGLLFLIAIQLGTQWFFTLFVGGLIFAVSLAPRNRKAFYLALLVFTIPIGVDVNLYVQRAWVHHSTHGFLFLLYYLPLLALYVIWAGRCLLEHSHPGVSTRGLAPLAAFFGTGVTSVLLGGNIIFGAFDLFALLGSIGLFVYTSSELRTKRDLQIVLVALFVAVWVQGVIAVGQYVTRSSLGLEFFGAVAKLELQQAPPFLPRVGGTIGAPNALARFFDLFLPLGVSLLFCPLRWRTRLLLATAVGLGMAGLVVTFSRGGIVATGTGCLLILFVWLRRRIGLLRALCSSALVVPLLLVLVFWIPNPLQVRFFREEEYQAAYGRVPLLQVALNIIRDRPFFGVGLNNYNDAAPRYDNTPQRITSSWNVPVHNLFLYIAAQTGLVGLVSYLLFLLAILRSLWPALRASDPLVASAGLGVAVGMAVFFTHGQIEFESVTRHSIFWFVSGLAVSLGRLAASPFRSGRQ
jgi:putative inorganic carbon (HCO3(-)) transporter